MVHQQRRPLVIIDTRNITLGGQTISCTVKRSARAKYVRLEMKRGTGLTVIVPHSYDIARLPRLLKSKEHWILNNLARYARQQPIDGTIPYLGRNLKLIKRKNGGNNSTAELRRNSLVMRLGDGCTLSDVLEQWYRMQAERLIRNKADELSLRLGVSYRRLVIRGQRTLWGSCSRKGTLSINWKLVMAPETVIDYILIHELAHLKEMNHSKKFWALVAQHCPRWHKHREWLKEHEHILAGVEINASSSV